MDGQKASKYKIVHRVFVDLDNTLLPFDTLWPVWKAILAAGLRPKLSKDSSFPYNMDIQQSHAMKPMMGVSVSRVNCALKVQKG